MKIMKYDESNDDNEEIMIINENNKMINDNEMMY